MLPAPQANLMKLVIEGVMNANLPWTLVFVGVFFAVILEIIRIPVLPIAIGLYLPIHLSVPLMIGRFVKLYVEKKKFKDEKAKEAAISSGILYSSGMIAGEGLLGILLAVFAVIPVSSGKTLGDVINLSEKLDLGNIGSLVAFALLVATLLYYCLRKKPQSGAKYDAEESWLKRFCTEKMQEESCSPEWISLQIQ